MRRAFLTLGLVLTAACGDGDGSTDDRECNDGNDSNSLKGSYCEDTPMLYREVKFYVVTGALRIEYVRKLSDAADAGDEKTLQLIVPGDRVQLVPNTEIKLLDAGAQVRRLLAGAAQAQELTGELQPVSSLTLSEYVADIGGHVAGQFALLFKSGRTLNGDFDGTVEDARRGM